MNLLILGGTVFVGRYLVEIALERGHSVTLFHRGLHNPELFPQVERILGNRDGDLGKLAGRSWDAVIDTCGYVPRVVADSARALAGNADHYTFISSISVYSDRSEGGIDESSPVEAVPAPEVEEVTGETYGPLKVACELAAEAELPGRVLVIRPGLIVGPHDPTDRFTYWPVRAARGGAIAAPAPPDAATQFIDVRDLAEWTLDMVETRGLGVYNATGPDYRLTRGALLQSCLTAAQSGGEAVWIDEAFLLEQKVQPWSDLPLWIPVSDESAGFTATSSAKAITAGLRYRPLMDTARDTLAWAQERPADYVMKAGISAEREAEVVAAWRKR